MKQTYDNSTASLSPFKNTKQFGNHKLKAMSKSGTKIKTKGGRSLANMIDELVSVGPALQNQVP